MQRQVPSIRFRLSSRSSTPPFRQLVEQVIAAVTSGGLRPGDRLPSVRDVVTQITINPNTVHRAYRELEHLGLTEAQSGLGTFIAPAARSVRTTATDVLLDAWIVEALEEGLSGDQLIEMFQERIRGREQNTERIDAISPDA